jgi:tRNA/tmRNA/rRNA uracil-C5-methylase (TrmA/RlmC/RlmD family)
MAAINQSMVNCTMELLALHLSERILDLFCRLGNFSLPLATQSLLVTGVAGSAQLVTPSWICFHILPTVKQFVYLLNR